MNYFNEYLEKRGLTRKSLDVFFDYDENRVLTSAYDFARQLHAVDKSAMIAIFSDFDCDGLMSGIIAYAGLQLLGFKNLVLVDRPPANGYTFTLEAAKDLVFKHKPDIVLTCDVGITAVEAVNYLHDSGIKVFLTDHHKMNPETFPLLKADVIVDYRLDDLFVDDDVDICGAVTIYECFRAYLNIYSMEYNSLVFDDMMSLEHFAAVATFSDSMPVIGSNRKRLSNMMNYFNYLISSNIEGFEIRYSNDPFIQHLFENLCVFFDNICNDYFMGVDEDFMNFSMIPVINSIKRMNGSVSNFYHMLLFGTKQEADYYAKCLVELNEARKTLTKSLFQSIFIQRENQMFEDLIYVTDAFPGVYGLVAQNIESTTSLPTIVMNATAIKDEDGFYYAGSARSPMSFPIHSIVNESGLAVCAGHETACGFSVRIENLYEFYEYLRKQVRNYILSMNVDQLDPFSARLDAYDIFMDFDNDFYEMQHDIQDFMYDCKHYGPFGVGFPAPTILIKVHKDACHIEGLKYDESLDDFKHTKIKLGYLFQALLWNVTPTEVSDSIHNDYYYLSGKFKYSSFQNMRFTDFVSDIVAL